MTDTVQVQRNWKAPFFTIWTGQAFSLFGSNVAGFALVWWLTKSTGSATVLATATLMMMLPGIILGPFAGACVDRWNRRLVMIVADGFVALISAWLAYLFLVGALQPWHVYVIMAARSLGGTFQFPAMQASTSLMVPKEQLSRVAGMNQALSGVMNIIAPPIGALLISVLPFYAVMGIDVVTAIIAILPLFFVAIPQPVRQAVATGATSLWQDMGEGFRYVRGWPGLLIVMAMATVINLLLSPAFSLIPILVTRHFHGQALELGWMNSAWGIGVVAGGFILSAWGGFKRRVLTSMLGLIGMGIGITVQGLAPGSAFVAALGAMALTGVMNPICNGPLFAIMQTRVAPEMQGRVFTLLSSAAGAASPLGLAVAGPVSDWLGVRSWYVAGGVACLLMGVIGLMLPALAHMEDERPASSPAAVLQAEPELGE